MAEHSHNLPFQPTPTIGREREVRAACELLLREDVRLLTLTGPGGTGKTRVGVEVAERLLDAFPDGVVFVGLAPINDTALVIPTVAQAVGVRNDGSRPVLETLQGYLREQRVLLVLDNFEQIVSAAPALAELLATCADLKILVTSRARLHLRGEREYPVPPLPLPTLAAQSLASTLATNPAITLFVQRATDVRPDFTLTDENAGDVAEICRRLDGLPLAIELAAARIKLLPPRALLARLERRLPLLTGGARDLPERQRTLRDTIAWSYDLLDTSEQVLFRRLSVFVGGCTIEAAEAVCDADGNPGVDVIDGLGSLVDKSLLRQEDGPAGEPRFSMLETIREYALERFQDGGEVADVRRRHADFFMRLAERADPELRGPDQVVWMDRLQADHDNLRAALSWTQGTGDDPATALRLAAALVRFWVTRGHLGEVSRLEAALDAPQRTPEDFQAIGTRATALYRLASAIRYRGDPERSVALCEESVRLFRITGDRRLAAALSNLAFMLRDVPDFERARAVAEEGLTIARQHAEPRLISWALYVIASVLWFQHFLGKPGPQGVPGPRSPGVSGDGSDPASDASVSPDQPTGSTLTEDHARAVGCLEEALAIDRQRGDDFAVAIVLGGGGSIGAWAWAMGDYARAEAAYAEALMLTVGVGSQREVVDNLRLLALVAVGQDRLMPAARLMGAGEAAYVATRTQPLPRVWRRRVMDGVPAARARLSEADFARAWAEGQAMSLEQAVAYALRRDDAPSFDDEEPGAGISSRLGTAAMPAARPTESVLTRREREVAILIGRGYSNRQIGEALVITEKTAEVHARNVRAKLGLGSRAQIAAWAAQHGLLPPDD